MPKRKYSTAPIGQVIGRWTVLSYSHAEFCADRKVPRWRDFWFCRCECDHEQAIEAYALVHALAYGLNVGCAECGHVSAGKKALTHGMVKSAEYITWQAMKNRCLRPSHVSFHRYGGKGIIICEQWLHSFPQFLSDMGFKPTPKHEIERRDNTKGYYRENCYWATRQQQMENLEKSRKFTYNNETLTMSEWARRAGIHRATFRTRVEGGWSMEKILSTPLDVSHRNKRSL